jgi:hypothetical protein
MIGAACGSGVSAGPWATAFHPLPAALLGHQARRWVLESVGWLAVALAAVLLILLGATAHFGFVETLNPPNLPGWVPQPKALSRSVSVQDIIGPSLRRGLFFGNPPLSLATLLFLAYGFGIAQILMLALRNASAVIITVFLTLAVGSLGFPGLVSTWSGLWLLLAAPAALLTLLRAALDDNRQRVLRIRFRFEGPLPDLAGLGAVLKHSRTGNQWQALILNPDGQALEELRSAEGVADYEETSLTYEETLNALLGRKEGTA